MENIKNVDDAFIACGLDPNKKPDFSSVPEEFREYIQNHFELVVITKALNKKEDGTFYKPNYNDKNEGKYFPWFEVAADKSNSSGFGFSRSFCDCWDSFTFVGSRLCLPSPKHVKYSQEQFEKHHIINQLK